MCNYEIPLRSVDCKSDEILILMMVSDDFISGFCFTFKGYVAELFFELFDCSRIITKAPCYAIERIEALKKYGFWQSNELLIGTNDKYAYNGYWVVNK